MDKHKNFEQGTGLENQTELNKNSINNLGADHTPLKHAKLWAIVAEREAREREERIREGLTGETDQRFPETVKRTLAGSLVKPLGT